MYNIPQSIIDRVKRISKMDESGFEAFLSTLEEEAKSYIELSLLNTTEALTDEQMTLLTSLYIQYSMFAKLENDEVASDKLKTLNRLLKSMNEKATNSKGNRARFL